jgi:hypothetical protein
MLLCERDDRAHISRDSQSSKVASNGRNATEEWVALDRTFIRDQPGPVISVVRPDRPGIPDPGQASCGSPPSAEGVAILEVVVRARLDGFLDGLLLHRSSHGPQGTPRTASVPANAVVGDPMNEKSYPLLMKADEVADELGNQPHEGL